MSDLLPPNATQTERALALACGRYGDLPVIYRKLWNPDTCPVSLLPYLAYTFSVDEWNESWPEHIKRQTVKDALHQHRIKGSLKAVQNAIARFGTTAQITEWWQTTPKGEPHTFSVDISAQDNERQLPVLELSTGDDEWLFCAKPIPVNTSRIYRIRLKVRQTLEDEGKSKVYAGVATLDKDFRTITGGAGSHRYCAISGHDLHTEDGWQIFEGEITGEGDGHNQFRPGTAYIRPMAIVNYRDGSGTAQIAELECWDLFENQQLVPNAHFEQGKAGWSDFYSGETVPENIPGTITTAAFRPDGDLQTDIINAIRQAKPLRSEFDFNVGTVHPGTMHLSTVAHQVIVSRETFTS